MSDDLPDQLFDDWIKKEMIRSKPYVLRLLFLAICSMTALCWAHHFKGLPHFSYFENYPQVPQDEFLGQEGEYEFSLVIYDFQGINLDDAQQSDEARFYLIAFNLKENKVYNGPLTLQIRDREQIVYSEAFASSQEESIYALQSKLPPEGKYSLDVLFPKGETKQANIPFVLSSQKTHWGKWIAGLLVFVLIVVAIGSRKARIAQDRKENLKAKKKNALAT